MPRYLTDQAIFKCANNIFFSCSDSSQNKVFYRGAKLLTNNARLAPKTSPPTPCPILTSMAQGVVTFCNSSFLPWFKGIAPGVMADGTSLLTSDAQCTCSLGIPISLSIDPGNIAGFLVKDSPADIESIPSPLPLQPVQVPEIPKSPLVTASPAAKPEAGVSSSPTGESSPAGQAASEGKSTAETADKEQEEEKLKYRCGECSRPCKLQERYRDKTPPWQEAPLDLGSDSTILRPNYHEYLESINEEKRTQADKSYRAARSENIFKFQAHHIVSGKQVFQKVAAGNGQSCMNENVLRMAHVCDYDVNKAFNCIMLVSDHEDDDAGGGLRRPGLSEEETRANEKALNAYESMHRARIQWHVGHHSYSFMEQDATKLKSRIKFYTKREDVELKSYAELLSEEIGKIDNDIDRKVNIQKAPICPKAFVTRIDNLSRKIREYLEKFSTGFHLSYPYYVSKEAYNFAFQLPQTFTLMTVERINNSLRLKKFSLSRRMDGTINIKSISAPSGISQGDYAGQTFMEPLDREEIIKFCGNIEHFVFFGRTGPASLPFLLAAPYFCKATAEKKDAQNYLAEKAYDLLIWIRDNPIRQYKEPAARIGERLAERQS